MISIKDFLEPFPLRGKFKLITCLSKQIYGVFLGYAVVKTKNENNSVKLGRHGSHKGFYFVTFEFHKRGKVLITAKCHQSQSVITRFSKIVHK